MTDTKLKLIALTLMLIDHVGKFFPFMPIYLRWIGRLSAPIFFFCVINGITHTKSRISYLKRLYLFNILMAVTVYILNTTVKSDIEVTNNIFSTLLMVALIVSIFELKKENNARWKLYLLIFILWQVINTGLLMIIAIKAGDAFIYLVASLFANIFVNEGGVIFVLLGLVFYLARDSRFKLTVLYTLFCAGYAVVDIFDVASRILGRLEFYRFNLLYEIFWYIFKLLKLNVYGVKYEPILTYHYQFMMIASLPLLLLYNGQRGKNIKYFFYIFYPVHITVLFLISAYFRQ